MNDVGKIKKRLKHYKDPDRDFDYKYEILDDGFVIYDSYDIGSKYFKKEIITNILDRNKILQGKRTYSSLYKELSVKNALYEKGLFKKRFTNCYFKFKQSKFKEFIINSLFVLLCGNNIV